MSTITRAQPHITHGEIESFLDASLHLIPDEAGELPDREQIRQNAARWIDGWPEWMKATLVSTGGRIAIGDKVSLFGNEPYYGLFHPSQGLNQTSVHAAKILGDDIPLPFLTIAHEEGHRLDFYFGISQKPAMLRAVSEDIAHALLHETYNAPLAYWGQIPLVRHLGIVGEHSSPYPPQSYAHEAIAELIKDYLALRTLVKPHIPDRDAVIERRIHALHPNVWPVFKSELQRITEQTQRLNRQRQETVEKVGHALSPLFPLITEQMIRDTYAYYSGIQGHPADVMQRPELVARYVRILKDEPGMLSHSQMAGLVASILPQHRWNEQDIMRLCQFDAAYAKEHEHAWGLKPLDRLLHLTSSIEQYDLLRQQYSLSYQLLGAHASAETLGAHALAHISHPVSLDHVAAADKHLQGLAGHEALFARIQSRTHASDKDMANLLCEAFQQHISNPSFPELTSMGRLFPTSRSFVQDISEWEQCLPISLNPQYKLILANRLGHAPSLTELYLDSGSDEFLNFAVQTAGAKEKPTAVIHAPVASQNIDAAASSGKRVGRA